RNLSSRLPRPCCFTIWTTCVTATADALSFPSVDVPPSNWASWLWTSHGSCPLTRSSKLMGATPKCPSTKCVETLIRLDALSPSPRGHATHIPALIWRFSRAGRSRALGKEDPKDEAVAVRRPIDYFR